MNTRLTIGQEFECVGCGTRATYKGRCVESFHSVTPDGVLHFCTRRCFFECMARGGQLIDGREILALDGLTPTETIAELFRRHAIALDPNSPAPRLIEAVSQIQFAPGA